MSPMLTKQLAGNYTAHALEKNSAGIGVLRFKADSRHQRGFFVSVTSLLWVVLAGHLRMRRFLERGTPTCKHLPALIGVWEGKFQKTCSRRHIMSNIIPFSFEKISVRVITKDNEVWFVAVDVRSENGYTADLSKTKAVIPPRQSAAFFTPVVRQHTSMVGVENSYTTPEKGKLYAVSLVPRVRPTTRTKGGFSQKTKGCLMTSLTIDTSEIRCVDGLYSLNDLHKASGGQEKHRPSFFLRNEQTQALVKELRCANLHTLKTILGKGKEQGTFVCKELVIAYAAWISPAFHLKVIRTFLNHSTIPSLTLNKTQVSDLGKVAAELFPSWSQRQRIWYEFRKHFGITQNKDLPLARFNEACEFLRGLAKTIPATRKSKQLPPPSARITMPKHQADEIDEKLKSVAVIFHPFSDQFLALKAVARMLRGRNGKTGLPEESYINVWEE